MSHSAALGSRCHMQSSREESLRSDRQPLSNKYEILETAKVGSEVGIIASAEEFDQHFAMVIYRLVDIQAEGDYTGPFMIDADGIVRVADQLSCSDTEAYRFTIEALASDGSSSLSETLSISVVRVHH